MSADYPLLETIDSPADLRRLGRTRLPALAEEVRRFLLHSLSRTGGHLAANLGTVELTLALHHAFDTPADRLVWDVGHQCYTHKILTGRRERMDSLRQRGGLAGFPSRSESAFDAFGVGHSSTSISAALGMALGARGSGRKHVAVIGDGAMGAGMAFEALNHAGDVEADLLVVLNDNAMSISPNVGALNNHLTRLLSGHAYARVREGGKAFLGHLPGAREFARRAEEHVKGMLSPATLFEELGFRYFGPVDGHDAVALRDVLANLRDQQGPRLLHVVTRKGQGFEPAEADPCRYHGVGRFDPDSGEPEGGGKPRSFTGVFGDWACQAAAADERVEVITPAMREGSGLVDFARRFPERFHDVGIAEQHAVTLAGGLACEGRRPVLAIYSTFLQRAMDQLIHDIALQGLPVLFAIDRAGIVGPDGATHAGLFDLTFLRAIPGMLVMAPADGEECRRMLATGLAHDGPAAVRYPRDAAGDNDSGATAPLPLGRSRTLREGRRVALLNFGALLGGVREAGETLDATVVDMRFVAPLDTAALAELAGRHELLVTVEDHVIRGGAGGAVAEWLEAAGSAAGLLQLGLPHAFPPHGGRGELLAELGLDAAGIVAAVHRRLENP